MNLKPIFTNHSNEFISRINKLTSDVDKIKEFEKAKACDKPFIIVDKTKSQAYVYNKDIITDTFEVGVEAKAVDNDGDPITKTALVEKALSK